MLLARVGRSDEIRESEGVEMKSMWILKKASHPEYDRCAKFKNRNGSATDLSDALGADASHAVEEVPHRAVTTRRDWVAICPLSFHADVADGENEPFVQVTVDRKPEDKATPNLGRAACRR